jgi:hypothetical protein
MNNKPSVTFLYIGKTVYTFYTTYQILITIYIYTFYTTNIVSPL